MDDGVIGVVVMGAVTDSGDTVGDCDWFIGVSGQIAGVWQGFREREDEHCDGVVNGDSENLRAKWCCSEGRDEGNTCAGDNIGGVVKGVGVKEMDSCRVEGGGGVVL